MRIRITAGQDQELSALDLTSGKVYDVLRDDGDGYIVTDDNGDENIVFYDECEIVEESEA